MREFDCTTLYKRNLLLKYTEFLFGNDMQRLVGRFTDYDFDKENPGAPKMFEDEELDAFPHEDSCQAQAKLAEILVVHYTAVLKSLKVLRIT